MHLENEDPVPAGAVCRGDHKSRLLRLSDTVWPGCQEAARQAFNTVRCRPAKPPAEVMKDQYNLHINGFGQKYRLRVNDCAFRGGKNKIWKTNYFSIFVLIKLAYHVKSRIKPKVPAPNSADGRREEFAARLNIKRSLLGA